MQLQLVSEYLGLHKDRPNPLAHQHTAFPEILTTVSNGRYGAVSVIDDAGKLVGIVTDGDIRRAVMGNQDVQKLKAEDMMALNPVTIALHEKVGLAIETFLSRQISQLIVIDQDKPVGILHVKELMNEGYF